MSDLNKILEQGAIITAFDKARIKFLEEDIKEMERRIALKRSEIKNIMDKYRPAN